MLFSGLPPVVREQDKFHAGFTVRNASDRAINAVVSARQQSGTASNALAPIEVSLPAGESRNVGWDVAVPLDNDAMKWDVSIREKGANEDGDHLKVTQKVIRGQGSDTQGHSQEAAAWIRRLYSPAIRERSKRWIASLSRLKAAPFEPPASAARSSIARTSSGW